MRKADSRQHDVGRRCARRAGDGTGRRIRNQHRRDQHFIGDDDRLVQEIDPGRFATRISYDGRAAVTTTIR